MKPIIISLSLVLLVTDTALAQSTAASQPEAAKSIQVSQAAGTPFGNTDVVEMAKGGLAAEIIVARIKSSACDFDTSPTELQRLKAEGVPDAVLLAMVMAEKNATAGDLEPPKMLAVKLPAGTLVEIEAAYTINSQHVRQNELISFRVVNPVKVGGVTIIEAGATATGRVTRASRGGHFGRAGRLVWEMTEVTAADGTRLPLQAAGRIVGDSKGAKVATQTVITGLLLGPAAPLALLTGFKRGENAYLFEGKRFEVFTRAEATVNAPERR
ncbi:MAG: hypothetical protein ACRD9R_09100 [Pyrinomonadaceae bacterium]